ncbi:MAG: gliding motility-associated C-terminal domain-containing protein [Bacteroidota bacterium]
MITKTSISVCVKKNIAPIALLWVLFFGMGQYCFGQAPNISFQSTNYFYKVNEAINPLSPENRGGTTSNSTQATTFSSGYSNTPAVAADADYLYVCDWDRNLIYKVNKTNGAKSVMAGTGSSGSTNGAAAAATFNLPDGIVLSPNGDIYITDQGGHLIRKISANVVSTFAGSGLPGNADGIGTAASFSSPRGLAIDGMANIYVADQANNLIRKISPTGVVTTIGGNNFNTPTGLGVDAAGNVYVADAGSNSIKKISPTNTVTTLATGLNFPRDVKFDFAGNCYVTDQYSASLKKISATGIATTIAYGFSGPIGLAYDGVGSLFIADGSTIKKFILAGYFINKPLPAGLTFNENTGEISGTPTVTSPSANYIITAYNDFGRSSASINIEVNSDNVLPPAVAATIEYNSPNVYQPNVAIADLAPRQFGGDAIPPTIYGQVSSVATATPFTAPQAMARDVYGNIYVVETANKIIRKITAAGVVSIYAGIPNTGGDINGPVSVATFTSPAAAAFDSQGNMFVSDNVSNIIRKITPGGIVSTFAGAGVPGFLNDYVGTNARFRNPFGLATDAADNIYVADAGNSVIRKIAPTGEVTTFSGSGVNGALAGSATNARFASPKYIAFDANNNCLYVTGTSNNLIYKVNSSGAASFFAGSGQITATVPYASTIAPGGITVAANGELFFTSLSANEHKIYKISLEEKLVAVVGSGAAGAANGIGTAASFNKPQDLRFDNDGNLYIADLNNNQIRKVTLTGYTIDRNPPAGIVFDPTTGIFSGTPTTASAPADYKVIAYNAGGPSVPTFVNIEVSPPPLADKPNISYSTPQTYSVNRQISPLTPINTGGAVPQSIYGETTVVATGLSLGLYVAADRYGDVYVSEYGGNRIKKISVTPHEIVAGSPGSSAGKADGPVATATFSQPRGIVSAPNGSLYVAEQANNRIREIKSSAPKTVSTVAGNDATTHTNGYGTNASFLEMNDIAINATGTTLYVADRGHLVIRKIDLQTGLVSTVNVNSLRRPSGVDIGADGTLYIADTENDLVKKVSPVGVVSNFGLNFSNPRGVRVDGSGNLYVADQLNDAIKRISPDGTTTTVLQNVSRPIGLSLDKLGNLYIAGIDEKEVWRMSVSGYTIDKPLPRGLSFDQRTGIISGTPAEISPATTYTITAYNGGGSSVTTVIIDVIASTTPVTGIRPNIKYTSPQVFEVNKPIADWLPTNTGGTVPESDYGVLENILNAPNTFGSITADAGGSVYFSDQGPNLIRRIEPPSATPNARWGSGANGSNDGPSGVASFSMPHGVVVDQTGNIYVSEIGNNFIRKININGDVSRLADGFNRPKGIALDATGEFLYVADEGNNLIKKVSTTTGAVTAVNAGTLNAPSDVCFDDLGNLYILNAGAKSVLKLAPDGTLTTFVDGLINPREIVVDGLGDNCYISGTSILRVSKTGEETNIPGFVNSTGLALDRSAKMGGLYIVQGGIIKRMPVTGYTINPTNLPGGLIFDGKTGKISGTPTVLTGSTPVKYTVTGYNIYGSHSTDVELRVEPSGRVRQTISLPIIPPKLLCNTPFLAGATSTNTTLPIKYTSSNTAVAEVDANTGMITLKSTGTTNIIATQLGDAFYLDATPQTQALVVNVTPTPTVKILDNRTATCTDQPVKFDAEVANLGGLINPKFEWFLNGVPVANNNTATYSTLITVTDEIKCKVTNNDACVTFGEDKITNVSPKAKIPLTLTIQSSVTGAVCEGTNITFTALPNFDNYQNHYQWQVNGVNAGTDNASFSSTTFKDGDIVSCSFNSTTAPCVISPNATASNPTTVRITMADSPAPQVAIAASGNNVYAETRVSFNATTTNTAGTVKYQWLVNGVNVGSNSAIYTSAALKNADKVTCVITTGNCNPPIISNEVFMTILPPLIIEPTTAFTPNGDGINDLWLISGLSTYPNCLVNVYNRQGQNVFQSKGYSVPWDGLYKAKALPAGTYYYIIDLSNGKPKVSGYLTLIR